jgi:hypothetical protein
MSKRIYPILAIALVVAFFSAIPLQYLGSQRYLAKENRNFEKSKLNCIQLPIHCAIRDKDWPLLNGIVLGDPQIESLDGWLHTPLYFAITFGADKEAVEILLNKGANPNVYDEQGVPALYYAIEDALLRNVDFDVAETLLKHGAQIDIEVKEDDSRFLFPAHSPLGLCISRRSTKCVSLLLSYGANVDWKVGKKYSVYETVKGESDVSNEIKILLEKAHNKNTLSVTNSTH